VEVTCLFTNGRIEKTLMPLVQAGSVQRFRWAADQIPVGVVVDLKTGDELDTVDDLGGFTIPLGPYEARAVSIITA